MKRFSELNGFTYRIAVAKGILFRKITQLFDGQRYTKTRSAVQLPVLIYSHKSLIRRKLGNVDAVLQDNKAINLSLASPKINRIIIKPEEVFSFWKLVGSCTKRKGYKEGLIIKSKQVSKGVGGGMCQLTNLLHWMVLHSPLDIIEHHHHNNIDMFPDYGRKVPFGTGTSIMYNYLDYQFINNTNQEFQIIVYTTEDYLCGELRSDKLIQYSYHIKEENHYFSKEQDGYYRNNEIYREVVDKKTGNLKSRELIISNHSKVIYDKKYIPKQMIS